MRRLIILSLAVLVSCSGASDAQQIEIDNFKFGLMCRDFQNAEGETGTSLDVCFETDEVYITGQGSCSAESYDGPVPCTWYGYEFDYANAVPGQTLNCTSVSSHKASYLNPDAVVSEDVHSFDYTLTLDSASGHFRNPQYSIFSYASSEDARQYSETTCSAGDTILFRHKETLLYPVRPE